MMSTPLAVDDLSVQGIECLIRTCNFVKESYVEDSTTVYRASKTSSCEDADAVSVEESLRLPCAHYLCCDSIQAATCILMNEVGPAPLSNRVAAVTDEELLLVEMQHLRYMVSHRSHT